MDKLSRFAWYFEVFTKAMSKEIQEDDDFIKQFFTSMIKLSKMLNLKSICDLEIGFNSLNYFCDNQYV